MGFTAPTRGVLPPGAFSPRRASLISCGTAGQTSGGRASMYD